MQESGSSYVGTKKEFLHGAPLNISAMRFGPDGNLYFLVGGRNTDSKLYRVRYTGPAESGVDKQLLANQAQRDLRHSLEGFHGSNRGGTAAIDKAWPQLGHADRDIRYAARLAIENQDLDLWRDKVFAESNPRTILYATIALCRHGEKSLASRVLAKLGGVAFEPLDHDDRLAMLRAYSLCLLRLDPPTPAEIAAMLGKLDPHYPAEDEATNTELVRLLSHLDSPTVVDKTIHLMQVTHARTLAYDADLLARHEYGKQILKAMANTPNSQNIHYAYCLRRVQNGWSLANRRYYFTWLNETLQKSGGQSFAGYIRAIREDAIDHLPQADAAEVASLLDAIAPVDLSKLPVAKGPLVTWTTATAMQLFETALTGRDFDNGKRMFSAGKCVVCHRFDGSGGLCGPDLGAVAQHYSVRDIVDSICEPSRSISEQYQASVVTLADGTTVRGRVIHRDDQELTVAANPYDFSDLTRMPVAKVQKVEPSPLSMMPPALIWPMNGEEVRDLLAYLLSGGDREHKVFRTK